MTKVELKDTLADERLAPFLLAIASIWERGGPDDFDLAAVCMDILRHPGVDLGCREVLSAWLDPVHPPTARDLLALHDVVERERAPAA